MDSRFLHLLTASVLTAVIGLIPYIVRRNRIAYYFAGAHVFLALWCLNESVTFLPASHSVKLMIFRATYIFAVMMVWYFFHFLLGMAEIPLERFPWNWRAIRWGGVISILLCFTPWQLADIYEKAPFREIPGPAYPFFIVFMLWGLGLPLYQLGRAYKNTHGHARTQLKYLFVASCIAFLEGLLFFSSLYAGKSIYYYFYLEVLYSIILAYAILAHQLMDITVIVRKTLEYTLISVILTLVYVGVVSVAAQWIENWANLSSGYSAALAVGAVALLFNPLRGGVQSWLDKRFSRLQPSFGQMLGEFSDQMRDPGNTSDLARALFELLGGSFQLTAMGLYLRDRKGKAFEGYCYPSTLLLPGRLDIHDPWIAPAVAGRSEVPVLPDPFKEKGVSMFFPMKGSGGLVGFLLASAPVSDQPLLGHDRQIIESVLQQAAIAYEQIVFFQESPESFELGLLADVARGFVHEIKTPLANINFPAQAVMLDLTALEEGKRPIEVLLPKFKERMKFIMTQAIKASDRIDAIRQFATLQETRLDPVELGAVLNESIGSLEPMLEKAAVRVHIQVPVGLSLVRANPKQLEIVFVNLIKNAVEAMTDESIPVQDRHLWVTIGREDARQVVEIRDSGPGIEPEDLPRVFEPHFTTKGKSGTGVGLHLTRQLVEALGGTISVSNAPEHGAAFRVKFPTMDPHIPMGSAATKEKTNS